MRVFLSRRVLAALCAAAVLAAGLAADRASGQSEEYPLYYSFDIPLAMQGATVTDEGQRLTYTGTFRGTLGALPVTDAKYTYATGTIAKAGGGTFSLATPAGAVKNGQILMTSDGKQTTLLFLGQYLGASLSFSLNAGTGQLGGGAAAATGLAETNFHSHEQYVTAVRNAAGPLSPADREQLVARAEQNLRLVRDYQQRSPAR